VNDRSESDWKRIYIAVLVELVVLISLFYYVTLYFK
jgi:hypothetical protein